MPAGNDPKPIRRPLVWFRTDLRVRDNPALHAACTAAAEAARNGASDAAVTAVFLIADRQWREHGDSPWKVDFLRRSLVELRADLLARGIPLRIVVAGRFASATAALRRVLAEHGCDALCFNREHQPNELRRDHSVQQACARDGIPCHAFTDQLLLPPDQIRTGQDRPYTVYTPFRKAGLGHLSAHGLPRLHGEPPAVPRNKVPADPVPDAIEGFPAPPAAADLHPAGERAALQRLAEFTEDRLGDYAAARDFPARPGTSGLSPHLAAGTVALRRCLEAARLQNRGRLEGGGDGADTWIRELLWREFYRHVLVNFPRLGMGHPFQEWTDAVAWRDDPAGLRAWQEGRTGYPIVDAAMRCLVATGFLHNRLRMVAASFLTKDLLVDWRRGEAFFMQHLVDGDLASNNGGWQWSASVGNDAAPYFRVFHPTRQGERFDPDGAFVSQWVPELAALPAKDRQDPSPAQREACGYPAPIVDHGGARLRAIEAFRAAKGN